MENTFNAFPTKEFFINMLTRDILLDRAILDLIDNSIDGARNHMFRNAIKNNDNELFKGYEIRIAISSNEIIISDNCGGFSIEDAKNYAFRTGKPPQEIGKNYESIGRFGIGMKRALFKMGKEFWVESKSDSDHFIVEQNVIEWRDKDSKKPKRKSNSESWSFEFEDVNSKQTKKKPKLKNDGTYIKISNLYENIKRDFKSNNFKTRLKDTIERTYNYCIQKGLKIYFGSEILETEPINLLYLEGELEPYFLEYTTPEEVLVKIYAGIGPPDPNQAGWYIFCNDRLMVEKERTNLTGWEGGKKFFDDTGVQKYHNKVAMFRGLVFMYSKDVEELPMTTTKTGIDYNSSIYTELRSKMVVAMKNVLSDLRKVSSSEQRDYIVEKTEIKDVLTIKQEKLTNDFDFKLWDKVPKNDHEKGKILISYKVEKEIYNEVKKSMKAKTKQDVGLPFIIMWT